MVRNSFSIIKRLIMVSKFQRDLKKELQSIGKIFQTSFKSSEMRKIGNQAVVIIRRRTKLGFGVARFYEGDQENTGNRKKKLKRLSTAYVKQRASLKRQGKLDTTTTPRKSNLTKTGQMLRKLQVDSVKNGSVIIKTKGRRLDGLDNEQVAEFVSDAGRPWLDLTNLEQKQIARFYQNNILKPVLAKI